MPIEKITYVHEFLCRFDRNGFKAAHIAHIQDLEEDGVVIPGASKFLDAQPVTCADSATLAEVSAVINSAALADNTAKAAQLAAVTSERDAALRAKNDATAKRDAALAHSAKLLAQLDALQQELDALKSAAPSADTAS